MIIKLVKKGRRPWTRFLESFSLVFAIQIFICEKIKPNPTLSEERMVLGDRQKTLLQYLALSSLIVLASACSVGSKTPTGALSAGLSAAQQSANQAMESAAAELNQSDRYALTQADLSLLESQGLIDSGEKGTLSLFAKN